MGFWFGQELKQIRTGQGLSIRVAAARAGLPHMTYVAYELGKAVPPAVRRPPLAEALGLTPLTLDNLIEEDACEVFLCSRRMSEEGKSAARDFLRRVREDERKRSEGETKLTPEEKLLRAILGEKAREVTDASASGLPPG